MSINYIIASSSKTLSKREKTDPYSKYVLQYHLQILNRLLETSSCIKQITIGCQITRDSSQEYYNIGKQVNELRKKGIIVKEENLPLDGISYLQYVRCFKLYPNFDYYLIMEDDWCINTKRTPFDTFLLDRYKETFPTNIGFLNCWSPKDGRFVGEKGGFKEFSFHSTITLGLLSKQSMKEFVRIHNPRRLGQQEFSTTLLQANIPIVDFPQIGIPTQLLFWQTASGMIEDFTDADSYEEPFFVPVQYYYKRATYFHHVKHQTYVLENRDNLFQQQ